MRLSILRVCSLVHAVALAAGCDRRTLSTDRDSTPWITVTQNPSLKVSLDTSRTESDSLGTTAWLRFEYTVTNPPMTDMPQPWRRMESQHVLDCVGHRARDIAMIIIDTAGTRHDGSHVLSPTWQDFDKHPLTVNLLTSVCATLEGVPTRRGA